MRRGRQEKRRPGKQPGTVTRFPAITAHSRELGISRQYLFQILAGKISRPDLLARVRELQMKKRLGADPAALAENSNLKNT